MSVALACLSLGGCAIAPLSVPTATLESIQAIRAAGLPSMGVGKFVAAPGRPTEMDQTIMARAGVERAPTGSFAKYLGDTLQAQLVGAGRFDGRSSLVVTGVVTDTYLATETARPAGRLAARFTLLRAGRPIFEKTLSVEATWEFFYLADVAVPDAFNHYAGLFPRLIGVLLADPDFQAAAGAQAK